MKNASRCIIVFFKDAGTAGDDPTLTLEQATAVAGTGAKALTFTTIYTKQGTLTSVGTWTKATQAAANTYTDATSAESSALWAIEVRVDELDTAGNFDCIRISCSDTGILAQLGCALYILETKHAQATLPSAIAD